MRRYLVLAAAAVLLTVSCDRPSPTSSTDQPAPAVAARPSGRPVLAVESLEGPRSATLPDGRVAERRVHIFYRRDFAKPGGGGGKGGGGKGGGTTCYSLLANGAKWKVTEDYLVDPQNGDGLADAQVTTGVGGAVGAWNTAAGTTVFGVQAGGLVDGADDVAMDGKNEVLFGAISDPRVIAVTITWGVFGGPPFARELLEWDMVLNDPDFTWGDAGPTDETNLGNTSLMDLLDIATHEAGHAAGLSHPDNACTEETMYAYATEGETKKRTLHAGDLAGILALYK